MRINHPIEGMHLISLTLYQIWHSTKKNQSEVQLNWLIMKERFIDEHIVYVRCVLFLIVFTYCIV